MSKIILFQKSEKGEVNVLHLSKYKNPPKFFPTKQATEEFYGRRWTLVCWLGNIFYTFLLGLFVKYLLLFDY